MKLKGLKKAIGDFKRVNAGGDYSPSYGLLMLHTGTGEIWVDYFYDLGHNSWIDYHDEAIVNLGRLMHEAYPYPEYTMKSVQHFVDEELARRI